MKLTDLEPEFIKCLDVSCQLVVDTVQEADGLRFLCPKCFADNKGKVGTHSVVCWRPHISQDHFPKPGRWEMIGTSFDNLSLRAGSSSVQLIGGCNAHFFVENGQIRMC